MENVVYYHHSAHSSADFTHPADPAAETGGKVVRDGKIITAAGMGVAQEFGLALIAALTDDATANRIRAAIQA